MNQMPVVAEPVFAGVLAHGRDEDAVGKGDSGQLDGRKQTGAVCGQSNASLKG
jgi:hypothetical protein